MVCFDGNRIYYVNRVVQLKCYDMDNGNITRHVGVFVRAIYYDGSVTCKTAQEFAVNFR